LLVPLGKLLGEQVGEKYQKVGWSIYQQRRIDHFRRPDMQSSPCEGIHLHWDLRQTDLGRRRGELHLLEDSEQLVLRQLLAPLAVLLVELLLVESG